MVIVSKDIASTLIQTHLAIQVVWQHHLSTVLHLNHFCRNGWMAWIGYLINTFMSDAFRCLTKNWYRELCWSPKVENGYKLFKDCTIFFCRKNLLGKNEIWSRGISCIINFHEQLKVRSIFCMFLDCKVYSWWLDCTEWIAIKFLAIAILCKL